jgi:hypothetical protein
MSCPPSGRPTLSVRVGVLVSLSMPEWSWAACGVRDKLTHGLENHDGNSACRARLVPAVACVELDHAVPEPLAFGAIGFSRLDLKHSRTDLDLRMRDGAEVMEPRWMARRPAVGGNDRIVRSFSEVGEGRSVRPSGSSAGAGQKQHRQTQESTTDPAATVVVDPSVEPPEQADHR